MNSTDFILSDPFLTLRPLRLEHAVPLYHAVRASLDDLIPWMSWAHPGYSLADARQWVMTASRQWKEGQYYGFAIFNQERELIGSCSLGQIHPYYRFANLGYWVHHAYRGRGIAGRAARLVARFGFEALGLLRIEIVIALNNHASRRVAEKIGAHFEGVLRNRLIVHGRVQDAAMYSLIPQDIQLFPP
ncbi:MAG: GNAT family N-acetyltransferase [Anaerolineales bacterium]